LPLFICSNCRCIENTAVTDYAYRHYVEKKPPLCSICMRPPGKAWHGHMPRKLATPALVEAFGHRQIDDFSIVGGFSALPDFPVPEDPPPCV